MNIVYTLMVLALCLLSDKRKYELVDDIDKS